VEATTGITTAAIGGAILTLSTLRDGLSMAIRRMAE
jgi:hypothetical protein